MLIQTLSLSIRGPRQLCQYNCFKRKLEGIRKLTKINWTTSYSRRPRWYRKMRNVNRLKKARDRLAQNWSKQGRDWQPGSTETELWKEDLSRISFFTKTRLLWAVFVNQTLIDGCSLRMCISWDRRAFDSCPVENYSMLRH